MIDSSVSFVLMTLLFFIIILFMFAIVVGIRNAYRNGVRDGYQNTFLPHVQDQIRAEKLEQGEEVRL